MNTSALTFGLSLDRTPAKPVGVLGRIASWIAVSRERTQLSELDTRMLEDIGLTREEAIQEAGRPFWDLAKR